MQALHEKGMDYRKNPKNYHLKGDTDQDRKLALRIADCTTWGSNPKKHKDQNGNLTTPIYVVTWEQNGKLYIQYLFFYGFNGPYDLLGGLIQGDVTDVQDAHEGDLEHVTMELDKNSKQLLRIYYNLSKTRDICTNLGYGQ
jgi:hypothetical protein